LRRGRPQPTSNHLRPLSDAIESLVNLVGGIMALAMLTIASRPAGEDHPCGHSKAEYFSSSVEGSLVHEEPARTAESAYSFIPQNR
jgi:hypothetical protein